MKKTHLWILTLVLTLTGCATYVPLKIPDTFNKVVVANFSFLMEELELPEEDKGGLDILTLFRVKEVYDDIKESVKDSEKPLPYKEFLNSIYLIIENGLKNELNIPIQPLKKHETDIQHDFYGFPLDNVSSVAKSGKFDAAMDILVDISFPSTQTSTSSWGAVTKTRIKSKPKLTLEVKMVDKNGKVIWRDHVDVKSNKWVIIEEKWLMAIKYKQDVTGPFANELTKQVVKRLVEKNKNL